MYNLFLSIINFINGFTCTGIIVLILILSLIRIIIIQVGSNYDDIVKQLVKASLGKKSMDNSNILNKW